MKSYHFVINFVYLLVFLSLFFFAFADENKRAENQHLQDSNFTFSVHYEGMHLGQIYASLEKVKHLELENYPFKADDLKDFYYYSLVFHPKGLAKVISHTWVSRHWLTIYQDKLVNLSYFSDYQGTFKEKRIDIHYDLENEQIINNDTAQIFHSTFPSLNSFSIFLSLAYDLLQNKNIAKGQSFQYSSAKEDESDRRNFVFEGVEELSTVIGRYQSYVFDLKEEKYTVRLWLAAKLSFLPVKIVSSGKRGLIEIQLTQYRLLN